jgi:hypothetical protein
MVERWALQYPNVSIKKIVAILKQINYMKETVPAENIEMEHIIAFATEEDREVLANLLAMEGVEVRRNPENLNLSVFNAMKNDEKDLIVGILKIADQAAQYRGSYKGWAIK